MTRLFKQISVVALGLMVQSVEANDDLFALEFEQLLDLKVISVSKKSQSIKKTAAAIHVITQNDIQRSGATTLPEVLRGAPGVHVARVNGSGWAISIRGFNNRFADKLLVLVDGRSVYTPMFAGVYWSMLDMPLSTIERVEIVRGSGGTLWGNNAVNGVINIITKHTIDDQGTEVSFLGGSHDLIANILHTGQLNEDINYRVHSKVKKQQKFSDASVEQIPAYDEWENAQVGFRLDYKNNWLVEGDYVRGNANNSILDFDRSTLQPMISQGNNAYQSGNLVVRFNYEFANHSELQVQGSYQYLDRATFQGNDQMHFFDIDTQYQFTWGSQQDIVWGLGYRGTQDNLEDNNITTFTSQEKYSDIISGFIQDEIQLSDDFRLTIGSKFSYNDFSGFEYQPSARILWELNNKHSLWSSIGRAVRLPTRIDQDSELKGLTEGPALMPALITVQGNPNQKSEELISLEFGYRGQFFQVLDVDTTIFYNHYTKLRGVQALSYAPLSGIQATFDNGLEADSVGLEIASRWQVTDTWQLKGSYSFLKMMMRFSDKNTIDSLGILDTFENSDPQHQFSLQSNWKLPFDLALNNAIYYTSEIDEHDVKAFTRVDLGLTWKPVDYFEASLVGQNLFDASHKEYASTLAGTLHTEVPRSVYLKMTTRF